MLKRLRMHPSHTALGIGLIAIGIWLITNDRFFPWPPEAVDFLNDDFWGALYFIDGVALLAWTLDGGVSVKWNRRLLSASAGLIGFLSAYQFLIWIATGIYMSWISNFIITAFVLILARRSDAREE